ncbi:hypothetical protein [Cellulomonas sp. SLBN-39]|uniref:hypothetical protein n=1 Tax=Cellulomonas sp. SLBN-39 TaxID=2768446 RepID=UPI001152320A|nr:hypothetical protein [Cellulomonas sp. SLBN-39]TQL02627.1 hypothetical protein FBY24_1707 [Cellulomonas sp. SLBN-39]
MTSASARLARAVVALALATTTVVVGASTASADPGPASTGTETVVCRGDLEGQETDGDVRVPTGRMCRIYLSQVGGDLLVDPGGEVRVVASTVVGDVISSGYVRLGHTVTVEGRVWLDDAYRLGTDGATILGSVKGRAGALDLYGSSIGGSLNVSALTRVYMSGVDVGGWVNLPTRPQASLQISDVEGQGLTVRDAEWLSMCEVHLAEHLVVRNVESVAMGYPNDDGGSCMGRRPGWGLGAYEVSVGGSALLDGNGTIRLRRLDVAEHLACVGNDEVRLDPGDGPDEPLVTAGVGRRGQCVDLG